MTARLALVGARAGYGAVEVLHGIDLVVPRGAVVAVLGRNGAGKSSAVAALAGTLALRGGRVLLDGHDITRASAQRRATAGIATVPADANVFLGLTVRENLAVFSRDGCAAALEAFPELGRHLDQIAGTLSGGERQMLALARVLVRPAPVVIVDEPARGLAAGAVHRAYEALAALAAPARSLLVVDQERAELLALCDVVYVLGRGEVRWAGEPGELTDAVRRAVLA